MRVVGRVLGLRGAAALLLAVLLATTAIGPVSATDVPGPAAASVSCAARGGSLTGVRVVGDLLADTAGDCALVDVVVTGDLVVSARTTVRGHGVTVKRDLRVDGSVVLSGLSVFGGVSLRSGMNQVLSLSDSYVRHSVRGRVPSLGLLRTHVEGAVRITTAHRLTVRGSTIGGWVTSDGGVQVAESTLVRGLTARSTQPSRGDVTILCRSSVAQDVTVIGMRAELEQAPGPNTACPTPDGSSEPGPRSSIGGSLRLVDTYGIRLTHLDVAGDLRCTNLYGTVTVDPDVTVAGERTGACAAQP
jgi:cytoskeletal protein CcmA (bactofilin family)